MTGEKLTMKRTHRHTVEVTGPCPFPVDMLRYDGCWPAEERDSNTIARTLNPMEDNWNVPYTVRLVKFDTAKPTWGTARWESFKAELKEVDFYEPK
jgi:hypothetical protein